MSKFNLEEAIKEEKREEGASEEDIENMDAKVRDIVEVVKTIDVDKTNEYMVLTQEGLFFIKIIKIKRPGNATPTFKFEFSSEEHYFPEDCVKGAFEYQPRKIIALINGSRNIRFINRSNYKEDASLKFENLSKDNDYKCLKPFPTYNYETFPYVLIKDSKSLNVINVRTMQSRVIIKSNPFGWDVLRTYLMDFQKKPDDESTVTLFNVELVSKKVNETSRAIENISTIKKFTINLENLDSCFN